MVYQALNRTISQVELCNTFLNTNTEQRNPYVSKWNILFDKPSQWISFKPQLGHVVYPCYACRDMFGSRNSFIDHTNRRSILLKYKCEVCSDYFTFYNPCSLLLHVREHFSLMEGKINLQHLKVYSLPFGLGGFLPEPNIPLLYNVQENTEGYNYILNTRFYSPVEETKGKKIVKLIANELMFFYNSPPNDICLILKQISSNIPYCEFVAKTGPNSEIDSQPPICAEEQIKEEKDDNQSTLEHCHFQRERSFSPVDNSICPECHEEVESSMADHFIKDNKPVDGELKCIECKYFAPTTCALKAHERIHQSTSPFVCPECGKEFDDSEALIDHSDSVCFHMAKQIRYKCPARKCGKVFALNVSYTAHFAIHINRIYSCGTCHQLFNSEAEFFEHNEDEHQIEQIPIKCYKCSVCTDNSQLYTEDNYQDHVVLHTSDRKHCFYVYTCKVCHKHFRSTGTFAMHASRCKRSLGQTPQVAVKKQNYVYKVGEMCLSCGVPTKPDGQSTEIICPRCKGSASLRNIPTLILMKIEILKEKNIVRCILCKTVLQIDNILQHFYDNECRYGEPMVILNGPSPDSLKKKRKKHSGPFNKLRKMSPVHSSIELEEPKAFDGMYRCKLCDFTIENRDDFHVHVKSHRYVSTACQCMECGECFVVKPSLIKHLLYYHQITDCEKYFLQNDCFDKEAVKELESMLRRAPGEVTIPVAENQCRVCLKQFSDQIEMSKHLRTHGMAFLLNTTK